MNANRVLWIAEATTPELEPSPPTGWNVRYCAPEAAVRACTEGDPEAIVLEFPLAGWATPALCEEVHRAAPGVPVLIRDPQATQQDAVRMTRLGVYQFLPDRDNPFRVIEQAIETHRSRNLARLAVQVGREDWEDLLLGDSRRCGR